MSQKLNILVVYYYNQYPMRATMTDHLYSFSKNSNHNCYYWNAFLGKVPGFLLRQKFDLIIFHNLFMIRRWYPDEFQKLMQRVKALKDHAAVKAVFTQDEYLNTQKIREFIQFISADLVFTVAPESEWPKIFGSPAEGFVKFTRVLTGYLDDGTVARIQDLSRLHQERRIGISYRSWSAQPWLGKWGNLKILLAHKVAEVCEKAGVTADISTKNKDTFLGDRWFCFLLDSKYTLGVEGGASLLDPDGSVLKKSVAYLREHPDADFNEVENACFKGLDGSLDLRALSPRHLEACATRTCQILIEGDYNGVLIAEKHYIALKQDFSNLDEVMARVCDDSERKKMTETAYADIVVSGKYSYREFTRQVLQKALSVNKINSSKVVSGFTRDFLLPCLGKILDISAWYLVKLRWKVIVPLFGKK